VRINKHTSKAKLADFNRGFASTTFDKAASQEEVRNTGGSTSKALEGDSPVVVVINKIDQHFSFDVNRKFLKEKYKGIFDFIKVSCATCHGIPELAEAIEKSLRRTPILTT
jgi:50S ribosomal subunit-associated GTPase HflX